MKREQDCPVRSFSFLCLILYFPNDVHYSNVTITVPSDYFSYCLSLCFFLPYVKNKQQQCHSPVY